MIMAFPIITAFSYFQVRLLVGRAQMNKKRLERSGQTVVESIDNIRTVASLGIEGRFYGRYKNLLFSSFK